MSKPTLQAEFSNYFLTEFFCRDNFWKSDLFFSNVYKRRTTFIPGVLSMFWQINEVLVWPSVAVYMENGPIYTGRRTGNFSTPLPQLFRVLGIYNFAFRKSILLEWGINLIQSCLSFIITTRNKTSFEIRRIFKFNI